MKIAFLITRGDSIGGAQVHIRDLACALRKDGHEVLVMVGRQGAFSRQLESLGLQVVVFHHLIRPVLFWRDLLAFREIIKALREHSPDLLSTHSSKAGWLGRIAGSIVGVPTLFTAHGWSFTGKKLSLKHRFYRWAEARTGSLARRVITVCKHDRRVASDAGVVPDGIMCTIHNGMPDVQVQQIADPGNQPPRLIMVARFQEPKDHKGLLNALVNLQELSWSLDLVGDGPLRPLVERQVSDLGLANRVRFLGEIGDVADCLAEAQLFVLATWREGFPRSILEAMRAGLPVVATEVGGIPEAVEHEVTGLLYRAGDVAGLAGCLQRLLTSAGLRRQFGAIGRARYEAHFTFEQMYRSTLAIYQECLMTTSHTLDHKR